MKTYKIEITETLQKVVEINADSLDDAIEKVEFQYKSEKIILESNDCIDTKISYFETYS